MYAVITIVPLALLLIIYVFSEESWKAFSNDFPGFTHKTVGPYFIIVGSIVFACTLKRLFIPPAFTKTTDSIKNPLVFLGMQLSALTIVAISFVYSFSKVNATIEIKYFVLTVAVFAVVFAGNFTFIARLKQIDNESIYARESSLANVLRLKQCLHKIKYQSRNVSDVRYIDQKLQIVEQILVNKEHRKLNALYEELQSWANGKKEFLNEIQKTRGLMK